MEIEQSLCFFVLLISHINSECSTRPQVNNSCLFSIFFFRSRRSLSTLLLGTNTLFSMASSVYAYLCCKLVGQFWKSYQSSFLLPVDLLHSYLSKTLPPLLERFYTPGFSFSTLTGNFIELILAWFLTRRNF